MSNKEKKGGGSRCCCLGCLFLVLLMVAVGVAGTLLVMFAPIEFNVRESWPIVGGLTVQTSIEDDTLTWSDVRQYVEEYVEDETDNEVPSWMRVRYQISITNAAGQNERLIILEDVNYWVIDGDVGQGYQLRVRAFVGIRNIAGRTPWSNTVTFGETPEPAPTLLEEAQAALEDADFDVDVFDAARLNEKRNDFFFAGLVAAFEAEDDDNADIVLVFQFDTEANALRAGELFHMIVEFNDFDLGPNLVVYSFENILIIGTQDAVDVVTDEIGGTAVAALPAGDITDADTELGNEGYTVDNTTLNAFLAGMVGNSDIAPPTAYFVAEYVAEGQEVYVVQFASEEDAHTAALALIAQFETDEEEDILVYWNGDVLFFGTADAVALVSAEIGGVRIAEF